MNLTFYEHFGRLCSSLVVRGSLLPDLSIKYAVERASCVSFPPRIVATFLQEDKPEVLDGPREWVFDPIGWVRVVVAMDCNYGACDALHDLK